MHQLREAYLRGPNTQLTKTHQKAAATTGYGIHRYEIGLTVKGTQRRHRYVKLHLLIALSNLAILNQSIAKGTRHDSPILKRLLEPIPKDGGDACLYPAYLAWRNCKLIAP
jgi:hypothetical protein